VRIVAGPLDHADLLPRCRAAVHHGGAGTTHVGLMAGIPAVICSVFADQPFWGARVERLGVGTHLPFVRLDAASLEAALRTALRSDVATTAHRLGVRIAAEAPAAAVAADRIEQAADRSRLTTDS
jgi:sterol 3beta-glucosyltransferase